MSEARGKVVEGFVDAWNRRDLDSALDLIDEDFEYVNPPNAMEPGTRRGTEGATTVLTKQWEGLADARLEIARVHHREDQMVTETLLSRGMPESTARLEVLAVMRWTFEGDRLVRCEVLGAGSSFNDALEQAGIAP